MFVIALTGGIGAGKSTVSHIFETLDVPVIDTDLIARALVTPSKPAFQAIVERLGEAVLTPKGDINRQYLAQCIFKEPTLKTWLESLLHPLIKAEVKSRLMQIHTPYCIIVVPLLVEADWPDIADRILLVDVDEKTQIERVRARKHYDDATISRILSQQATRQERLAIADDVLNNDQDVQQLTAKVQTLHQQYLHFAQGI